jgi:hypothetical protein
MEPNLIYVNAKSIWKRYLHWLDRFLVFDLATIIHCPVIADIRSCISVCWLCKWWHQFWKYYIWPCMKKECWALKYTDVCFYLERWFWCAPHLVRFRVFWDQSAGEKKFGPGEMEWQISEVCWGASQCVFLMNCFGFIRYKRMLWAEFVMGIRNNKWI